MNVMIHIGHWFARFYLLLLVHKEIFEWILVGCIGTDEWTDLINLELTHSTFKILNQISEK